MKQKLHIPMKAFSVNKMFCRSVRYKTPAFQDWSHNVLNYLSGPENQESLSALRNYFNPDLHYFTIKLDYYFPIEILFTQNSHLSGKAFDISNIEKPLIDLIFLPAYYGENPPYSVHNLNLDDKYILSMTSTKHVAKYHKIEVELEIKNLEEVFQNRRQDELIKNQII
jgi:hypothetical protein